MPKLPMSCFIEALLLTSMVGPNRNDNFIAFDCFKIKAKPMFHHLSAFNMNSVRAVVNIQYASAII